MTKRKLPPSSSCGAPRRFQKLRPDPAALQRRKEAEEAREKDERARDDQRRAANEAIERVAPGAELPAPIQEFVLSLLERLPEARERTSYRANVSRDAENPNVHSFVIGRNPHDPTKLTQLTENPVGKELEGFLRRLMTRVDEAFLFDAITVNFNLRCARHSDGKNAGPSYIFAVGDFAGGRLLVEPPGVDDPERAVPHVIRGRPLLFEGRAYHETEAFEGTRWSLVFYSWHASYQDVSAGDSDSVAVRGCGGDGEGAPRPRAVFRTAAQSAREEE